MKLNYSKLKALESVLLFFLFILPIYTFSQNCTVNANADRSQCPGGQLALPPDQFKLFGTENSSAGYLQNPFWTQIGGPAVNITDPNLVETLVTGAVPGNTYKFRLTAQCQDGATVSDDVSITILPVTFANAGTDQTYCQGTYPLNGNVPGAGETGTWTINGNNNAGITINNPNSPTSTITVSGASSGNTSLIWTISNPSGCTSFDEVVISTLGGVQPVTAGADINLSNCYSATQNVNLNGSFGGNTPGQQQGTWTVVSGPNVPTFANANANNTNVSGLVQGTYVFQWTVVGTCANGSDRVTVTVPPPTADVTNVTGSSSYYCDGRTSTVLQGTVPLYVNETVQWTQTGGPSATIANPTSPTTLVTGMTSLGTYTFLYTLTNSTTNCVRTGTYTIVLEELISISGGPDQALACNVSTAVIPVTSTGSGQMKWQIVDGPAVNPVLNPPYPSFPTPLVNFSGSSLTIDQLTFSGTYVVRIIKNPNAGSQCETVYDDVKIVASRPAEGANAGTMQVLACNATSAVLAGNLTVGTGTWSQASGPSTAVFADVHNPTTMISSLVNGQYEFRWTISGGSACDVTQSTAKVLVSSATPTPANAGTDQSICYGAPVQLQGNATVSTETGTWTVSPNAGITFNNVNSPNAIASGLIANTVYIFTWTIANGCGTSSDTVNITTNSSQGANADAGPDQCVATGTASITLAANNPAPGTGLWTQTSGTTATITNPSLYNTTVTGLSDGNYAFKWTVTNVNCAAGEDTVAITIAPDITTATAGPDQSVCSSTVTVTGNTPAAGETGLWEFVSGGDGPVITNPSSPTTTITGLTSGSWVYKWTISRGACPASSDSVQINSDIPPSTAVAGPDQTTCNNSTVTLAATPPTVGSGIWSLISGPNSPVFSNVRSATSTLSNLITGEYILEWTTYTGIVCPESKDRTTIKVTEAAAAGSDISTCLEGPLYLTGNDGSTGTWTYVSGPSTPTITKTGNNSASVTGLVPGVYVFRYTIPAAGSCPATSDDITVTINGQITTAPNAGPDQNLCNSVLAIQMAALPLDPGTIGKWTVLAGPTGGSFVNDTNPTTTFINPGFGIYVFNWTVSAGTCSSSDQVRVENAQTPSAAVVEGDNAICGSTTELTATPPTVGTGRWAQVTGPTTAVFSSEILPTTTVSNLTVTGGVYVFSWTVSNGTICTPNADTVQITVTADLTTPNAGPDQTICVSGNTTLAANTITVGTGAWSKFSGPVGGTFSNTASPTSTFTPSLPGTYVLRWTATNLSCTFFDDMTLTVDPLPTTANAGNPFAVCQFQPVNLSGNTPTTGTGLWSQVSGPSTAVFADPSSPTTSVLGTQAGVYVFRWTISSGSCPSSSSTVTVTINELSPLADAGVDQTICNTSTATLSGNNSGTSTGLWTFVSNAGNTAVITNPNLFNTTVTGISTGTTRLKWTISNGSCTPYSDEVQITKPSDLITSPLTANSTICLGGTITLSTTPSGSLTPYSYQWQSSANGTSGWSNISGQTNASYTTASSLAVGEYYYRVNVSNSCTQISSTVAKLTIIADPVVTTQPVGNTICSSGTHTMTVVATATNTAPGNLTYQWQSSTNGTSGWVNVTGGTGATTTTYTTAALTSNLYYRARVRQGVIATGCETLSNPVLVNVVTITAQPVTPAPVCVGGIVTVSIAASLNGGTGTLSYQWQSSADGTSGWANVSGGTGATTNSYTSGALASSIFYRCMVTSSATNCTLTSNSVQATVVADPSITVQPSNGAVCVGGSFTLNVTATGGTPGLNYQWYSGPDTASFAPIPGATSSSYTTPALTATTHYRVEVSATGNGCGSVVSDNALVAVGADPVVNQQPAGSTICSGNTHTMSVVASGNVILPLAYQWQSSVNGTSGWTNVTGGVGATTDTYTTAALTSTLYYRVQVTQSPNGCETFSNAAPVFVATITAQPTAPAPICVGGVVNLTITASLNGGAGTLSYQWQSSANGTSGWANVTGGTGATSNSYTSGALSVNTFYRCIVTSSTTNCTLTSNVVQATVVPDPSITVQPTGTTICSGGNHTLTVTATNGTPSLTYQWSNSIDNINFSPISGATSSTYVTPALTQTTYYRVAVSASGNGCTTITSSVATVVVLSDIFITTQPVVRTNICSGSTATLNVTASGGSGNYTYQWRSATVLAGPYTNISGATSSSYTTPALTQNTYYQVVISDNTQGCSPVTSNVSGVIIPSIITQPVTPATVCVGGTISLSTAASANGGSATFTYQWQSSPNGTTGWTNVSTGTGGATANYTSAALSATTYYRAIISSSNPSCTLTTNVVMATVIPDPTITTQPTGGNICEGGTFTMSSGATGGSGNFTYQWQKSLDGTTGWANVTDGTGANTTSYTTGPLSIDTFYRLQASESGTGCGAVNSNTAKVEVFESPLISVQPTDAEVCINQSHTFTVVASGNIPSGTLLYQWQTATVLAGPYTNVSAGSGATTASYTTPVYTTPGNRYFRVLISQSQAGCQTISNQVTLDVFDVPSAPIGDVTQQPSCTNATGIIAITDPDLGTGYEYSKDGTTFQASNIFSGLASGTVTIYVRRVGLDSCISLGTPFIIFNKICAVPENFAEISGDTGGTTTTTILDSDTLNGASVSISTVTVTVNTISPYLTLNGDNTITVASGTPADDYTLTYTICETANPSNCSTTTETVHVTSAGIEAILDVVPFIVNGYVENLNVINVLTNDRLNALPATTSNVIISVDIPATPINGAPVPVLNISNGNVDVPAGTARGLYDIKYKICEIGSLSNCDTANILIQVGTTIIDANDDRVENINGFTGQVNVINAINNNDTLNGVPITSANFDEIEITQELPADPVYGGANVPIFSTTTGWVTVPEGTPADTYYITYHICEKLNPTNCSDASIAIVVDAAPIVANDDVANNVNGYVGAVNVINAYINPVGADTFNGDIININLAGVLTGSIVSPATPINGGPVPELILTSGRVNVPQGTPAGQYQIKYKICENLNTPNPNLPNGGNCDDAIIIINVIAPPIIANDDVVSGINSYAGATNVINAYDNDLLNGGALDLTEITTTIISAPSAIGGGPLPTFDTTTGFVSVPPLTPAGEYKFVYRICENLNATNCDDATITITVVPAQIIAEDDIPFTSINGFIGEPNAINALDNDTLDGVLVNPADVEISVLAAAVSINGSPVPILDSSTGNVSVPAGTAAGSYTITYRLREILNLSNNDTAIITIEVTAPVIEANDDTVANINGYLTTANAINVLLNDNLNGATTNINQVTVTVDTPATSINGGLVPILIPLTGTVGVPAGTPAGDYEIRYHICEKLNATNCDDATVFISVISAPIDAVDDTASAINGFAGAVNVANALTNDTLNGVAVVPAQVTISNVVPAIPINGGAIPVLDPLTGNVNVPAGTASGTYIIEYTLSENLNIANLDTAEITIIVTAPSIVANNDSASNINGFVGANNVVNAIINDRLNGMDIQLNAIDITSLTTTPPQTPPYVVGNPVPVLNITTGNVDVPAGTSAGTYTIHYRICEKLNPSNCDEADIVINVLPTIINADNDFVNSINGYAGANNVINALANDELNGTPVSLLQVNIHSLDTTVPPASVNGNVPVLNLLTGNVDVPPLTTAGTYTIHYEICEKLNPTNCSDANIIVIVDAAPIIANDDAASGINGYAGATNILNAFDNDLLNGAAINTAEIKATVISAAIAINGGPVPALNITTGFVSVPTLTPAGEYKIVYQICENINAANCDQATITITVVAAPIVAVDDNATGINGFVTTTNVVNALTNDTLNGVAVIPSQVTINNIIPAASINGGQVPVLDPSTGNVNVPAGTAAGSYFITYSLSEKINITNTDSAIITIVVTGPVIEANDDTVANINGYVRTVNAIDVLANDTLNGAAADLNLVSVTVDTPATPINGGPIPLLEPLTGIVSIPAGTPAGDYEIRYHICEKLNATNCDDATVFINVISAPIDAVNDTANNINGFVGANNVINALTNDTLNGVAVVPSQVTISNVVPAIPINGGAIPVLDTTTGWVSVPTGTAAGTYTIEYTLNENLNTANLDTAEITIIVIAPTIVANDDSASNINGFVGATNVVNAITNDRLNGIDIQLNAIDITSLNTLTPVDYVSGNPVPLLNITTGSVDVPAGTSEGTYTIHYRICEKLNPTNCSEADIVITVLATDIIANDDFVQDINGYRGGNNIINALTNDLLNGASVSFPQVNIRHIGTIVPLTSTNGNVPVLNTITGNVDVPLLTQSGTYIIQYEICEKLNPANCSQASIYVVVDRPQILAEDDLITNIDGYRGAPEVLNALTSNDRYDGSPLTDINLVIRTVVSPATPIDGGAVPFLFPGTGFVSIPQRTPAGTYQIKYIICDRLNPLNCDEATITILVLVPPIVANDDAVDNINGNTGATNVLNAYNNDTLDGLPMDFLDFRGRLITPASSLNGTPVPVLNVLTGNVDVPAGTHAGTYFITYEICGRLNSTNCDQAVITVRVVPAPIDAVDDNATGINGFVGTANAINALDNDTLNGVLVTPADVLITNVVPATPINGGTVPTLDVATGIVSVPAGTTAGTYTISYRLREATTLLNYDDAIITIVVDAPAIVANDDTLANINGYVATNDAIDVLTNDTLNGAATSLTNVNITVDTAATPINGGAVPKLEPLTGMVSILAGTPAGDYEIKYHICENLNPINCNDATVYITVVGPTILAVDDSATNVNGYVGANNVINALTNDSLNGAAIQLAQVTITSINTATPADYVTGNPVPVLNIANGSVDVPPGTSNGTYTIHYGICENLNPTNCSEANIIVEVNAATILANNDINLNINGYVGAVNALNVLDNDSFNDSSIEAKKAKVAAINISQITITILNPADPINGSLNIPELDPATGIVSVPAQTPAGLYTIQYRIAENLNPSNFDDATVFITVTATTIEANNDTVLNINGFDGQANVINAITNDNLNGVAAQLAEITIGIVTPATPINAGPVPTLDIITGNVSVLAGTPSGTYTIRYSICENLNLTNCSEADIIVTVISGPIIANDDAATGINGLDGAADVINVLTNDLLDNAAPTLSQVAIHVLSPADPIAGGAIPALNPATGLVSVPGGTSSGIYTIVYEICENLNSINCDQAVIKIAVSQPGITLVKRGVFSDTNGDGYAQPGELIRYSFRITNTGAIDLTNVVVTDPKATIAGTPIATLAIGQFDTTTYTGTYVLTQVDIDAGFVVNQALVTAQPTIGTAIQDLSDSDDPTLIGNDDPTVTPVVQFKDITLIKGGILTGSGGVGSVINYNFRVRNTGNVPLTNVVITDPMLTTTSIAVTPSTLLPGADGTATASYTVTVGDVANGAVINTAMAIGDDPSGNPVTDVSDSTDPTLTADDDPTVIDLTFRPSIAVIKTATFNDENKNGYAEIGETVTYNFAVTNTGNVPLVNIVVKDPKPGITISGGPIILRQGETNTTAFVGIYVLTAADIDAGLVENQAEVDAVSPDGLTANDLSDDNSNLEDDPTILPLNACKVTIHNAVSPNGDDKNEVFKIDGIECYANAYVQIYDRWGVLVYDAYNYDNNAVAFKGISEGRATVAKQKRLPDGTYFYVITYTTYLNEAVSATGYLYLSGND
ncbi:gliding motility-associated C-terminal domain-containing protein [Flavobacterium sp. LC2016-12]|uniref:gliding motility-associated C-terminal domain-containing protein n=1 Tax=Flavobacterium sp. LC2016-12 TaxID=2783794 RepID=UPI00188DC4E0|nr:gliding motility-associated C-terminal domain-containing protein [Flavobacterium sp. LC2016-12]MBF4464289.1 gliding motility-associated C-terminal domain-containing protein [Flavobacterium sp. LC2016-12]